MLVLNFGPRYPPKPFCTPEEWDQAWVEAATQPHLKRLWERGLSPDLPEIRAELQVVIENSLPWERTFFTALSLIIPSDATEIGVSVR